MFVLSLLFSSEPDHSDCRFISIKPDAEDQSDDEDENDHNVLAIDDISSDLYYDYKASDSRVTAQWCFKKNFGLSGLSDFMLLNPRWLVELVACILRRGLR